MKFWDSVKKIVGYPHLQLKFPLGSKAYNNVITKSLIFVSNNVHRVHSRVLSESYRETAQSKIKYDKVTSFSLSISLSFSLFEVLQQLQPTIDSPQTHHSDIIVSYGRVFSLSKPLYNDPNAILRWPHTYTSYETFSLSYHRSIFF